MERMHPPKNDSFAVCLLPRREGQSIWIGQELEVKVLAIEEDRVKLGVCNAKQDDEPVIA